MADALGGACGTSASSLGASGACASGVAASAVTASTGTLWRLAWSPRITRKSAPPTTAITKRPIDNASGTAQDGRGAAPVARGAGLCGFAGIAARAACAPAPPSDVEGPTGAAAGEAPGNAGGPFAPAVLGFAGPVPIGPINKV